MPRRLLLSFFLIVLGSSIFLAFIFLNFRRRPQESPINLFLIQSGSMSPAINIGDVVATTRKDRYFPGEVITFQDKEGRTVTHRVREVLSGQGQFYYTTQGDASAAVDIADVPHAAVYGRVQLIIPFFGYLVPFVRTPLGFSLVVVLPGLFLAILYGRELFLKR